MSRDDVLTRLKSIEPALRARGIGALYLFGSHARDEATAASDIDVFVDANDDTFYNLSNFMGAYAALQDTFAGVHVDYTTRNGLSKYIRSDVEREAVRIF